MARVNISDKKRALWLKYLPWFSQNSARKGTPYDYFSVFFKDADNTRYVLHAFEEHQDIHQSEILLTPLHTGKPIKKSINELWRWKPKSFTTEKTTV